MKDDVFKVSARKDLSCYMNQECDNSVKTTEFVNIIDSSSWEITTIKKAIVAHINGFISEEELERTVENVCRTWSERNSRQIMNYLLSSDHCISESKLGVSFIRATPSDQIYAIHRRN